MRREPAQFIVVFSWMVEWVQDKIINSLGRATHAFYLGRNESAEIGLCFGYSLLL